MCLSFRPTQDPPGRTRRVNKRTYRKRIVGWVICHVRPDGPCACHQAPAHLSTQPPLHFGGNDMGLLCHALSASRCSKTMVYGSHPHARGRHTCIERRHTCSACGHVSECLIVLNVPGLSLDARRCSLTWWTYPSTGLVIDGHVIAGCRLRYGSVEVTQFAMRLYRCGGAGSACFP